MKLSPLNNLTSHRQTINIFDSFRDVYVPVGYRFENTYKEDLFNINTIALV